MSRALTWLSLVVFLIADVFLIVVAVDHVHQEPPASDIEPGLSQAAASSADQVAFAFEPANAAVLSAANDGSLVLGTRGTCRSDTPGRVGVSKNGGAKLSGTKTGMTEVLAVSASPGGDLSVVGLDATCTVRQVSTSNGGGKWARDAKPSLWFVSPTDVYTVVTPAGSSKPGCTVTSLSQLGQNFARVTCADGVIRGTGNGGDTWVVLGRLDNVRVATFTSATNGFALARFAGCAAQVFVTDDSGQTWEKRNCLTGDPARAIAATDTTLLAVVGSDLDLYASGDRGATFERPS